MNRFHHLIRINHPKRIKKKFYSTGYVPGDGISLMVGRGFDLLNGEEGDHAEKGAGDKRNAVIDKPQETADGRQRHGRDMVYRKSHRHGGCNIFGIAGFLKIGANGYGKIKEQMIENI